MAVLALALEKGEKIRADKEKQMKEEEAAVEAVLHFLQTIKVIVSGVSIISKNGFFMKSSYQRFEFFINMQN